MALGHQKTTGERRTWGDQNYEREIPEMWDGIMNSLFFWGYSPILV